MTNIPIGADVECADGPCGKSVTVIVNPATSKVTYVVVQERASLDAQERLVPVDQIVEATSYLIRLRCSCDDLADMEPFVERRFIEGMMDDPAYWYGVGDMYLEPYATPMIPPYEEVEHIPPGQLAIYRGTRVEAKDGHVGVVGELVLDPASEQITHLVLEEGHLWGKKEITLPLSAIDRVEADAVHLKLDKQAVEQLPTLPIRRHHRRKEPGARQVELIAKLYDNPDKGSEALQFVEDLHRTKTLKVLDAAVLVKEEDGTTSVKDTRDLEPKEGRILGAIAGGLVGLLAGPIGVVVGALAGLGAGGLAAKWVDLGFSDKFLAGFQEHLKPGKSALLLLVEHDWAHRLSEALADDEGIILQQTLTDELVQHLLDESEVE